MRRSVVFARSGAKPMMTGRSPSSTQPFRRGPARAEDRRACQDRRRQRHDDAALLLRNPRPGREPQLEGDMRVGEVVLRLVELHADGVRGDHAVAPRPRMMASAPPPARSISRRVLQRPDARSENQIAATMQTAPSAGPTMTRPVRNRSNSLPNQAKVTSRVPAMLPRSAQPTPKAISPKSAMPIKNTSRPQGSPVRGTTPGRCIHDVCRRTCRRCLRGRSGPRSAALPEPSCPSPPSSCRSSSRCS